MAASNEPNETSLQDTLKIFEHLRRSEEKPTLAAEFELNRVQIVRYADRFGYESFYDQQSQLEREVSNNGSLLEGFLGEGEQSDVSTFFLSDASDDCFLEADEYLRQVEGTKRLLEKVLTSVSERASKDQPRRIGEQLRRFPGLDMGCSRDQTSMLLHPFITKSQRMRCHMERTQGSIREVGPIPIQLSGIPFTCKYVHCRTQKPTRQE
ncbi:hypothetical protein [uncultured Roseobacter sp.]|uniref:hypothetical protein n=1 Tax=uncultured Roseobacter sp. TaxID=114847 RepID=UPI00261C107A|nr:hypothetical protein [uncultured Roseobacter sp.]